jgi:hypothetical protein
MPMANEDGSTNSRWEKVVVDTSTDSKEVDIVKEHHKE